MVNSNIDGRMFFSCRRTQFELIEFVLLRQIEQVISFGKLICLLKNGRVFEGPNTLNFVYCFTPERSFPLPP